MKKDEFNTNNDEVDLPKFSHNIDNTQVELPKSISLEEDYESAELPSMLSNTKTKKHIVEKETDTHETFTYKSTSRKSIFKVIKKAFYGTVVFAFILVAVYCTTKMNFWSDENDVNEKQMSNIQNLVVENVVEPKTNLTEDGIFEEEYIYEPNSEVDYSKLALVDVDFSKLKEINSDTVAYIKINGLDVSAPIVQTTDNDFYLEHTFDKTPNSAGWIFGDYRNDWSDLKDNTIVYGHNRKNYAMFGSLKLVFEESWYSNKDNHFVYISTDKANMVFEMFSAYTIPTETYYLRNAFSDKTEYRDFLNVLISRSQVNFGVTVDENDKILTLSTCHTNTSKTVIHAKLVKIQNK